MRPISTMLGGVAAMLVAGTFAMTASAQNPTATPTPRPSGQQQTQPNSPKPSRLDTDSTPAYQERNVTPPGHAATAASGALKTDPGKTSAGKEPPPKRPNGIGFDTDAGSMGKKP